jgi:hypothetical protein
MGGRRDRSVKQGEIHAGTFGIDSEENVFGRRSESHWLLFLRSSASEGQALESDS